MQRFAWVSQEINSKLSQIMKTKFYFLVISFLMALTFPLSAENITVDGIKYATSDTTATVIGSTITNGEIVIPESITYNSNTYSVTSIGNYAFYGYTGLTSVFITNSVTSIGRYAFYNCSSLKVLPFRIA